MFAGRKEGVGRGLAGSLPGVPGAAALRLSALLAPHQMAVRNLVQPNR